MFLTVCIYAILGLLLFVSTFVFIYYWTILRKLQGLPIYHVIPYIIRYNMKRKTGTHFTNFLFQLIEDMYKKHGKEGFCTSYNANPTFYFFGGEPFEMFLNEKAAFNKSPEYKILEDVIGRGLVTSNGERWRSHRKLMCPAFQLGMLKEKIPLFNDHAVALIEDLKVLEGKPSEDLIHFIKRHYFNALSESIFGLKQTEENKAEVMKYFNVLDNLAMMSMYRAYQPWLWPKFALKLLPSGKKYLKMYDEVYSFAKNVILEMKKHVTASKESENTDYFSRNVRKSVTYILLQHHLKNPSFTFEDIHGHVNTFMAAGFDTVSYSTMWCLFMLGLHPEIQEKAFQEVQSDCQNYVSYEEVNSFTYLEAIIMETLRLYPTVPLLVRSLSEDVQFGKHKVYKGTTLVFAVYFWHRNPDNFPDPEKFDPERFLTEEGRKPWQHIPFSEVNRACLGKTFALLEMKVFLAHFLRNFKIVSLDKKDDVELCCSVVLTPSQPLRMLITPRLS